VVHLLESFPLVLPFFGISEKPGVVDGQVVIRDSLSLTISFDHDMIDGLRRHALPSG
jgi:pyruvate/2-oxoglutarate dehydrogenase complex dihydrolipoamide acyltransferase (E2) component